MTTAAGLSTAAFVTATGTIAYIIAGYPLLLANAARRNPRPVRKDDVLRTVSIVVGVWNGEKFLEAKLNSILESDYPRELMEIIVVSDGSDDRTDEIAQQFGPQGVLLFRNRRSGKPAAVNRGMANATGEILILMDVRQTLEPCAIRNMVADFGDPEVGAVSGELTIRKGANREEADTGLYWRYEVFIRRQMSLVDSTFGTSGHFYAIRRSLAVPIPEDTLLDDVYLPMAAFFRGYRIVLESTARSFDYPTSLNSEFKRKVRTQAGLYQILQTYPQMLHATNRMRIHFVSAKFSRLLMPYLLILIAGSSFGLPRPFREIALVGQVLFYGAALLDGVVAQDSPLKRATSPIRTFVVLMAAAAMAIKIFFVPPRALWKETKVRV